MWVLLIGGSEHARNGSIKANIKEWHLHPRWHICREWMHLSEGILSCQCAWGETDNMCSFTACTLHNLRSLQNILPRTGWCRDKMSAASTLDKSILLHVQVTNTHFFKLLDYHALHFIVSQSKYVRTSSDVSEAGNFLCLVQPRRRSWGCTLSKIYTQNQIWHLSLRMNRMSPVSIFLSPAFPVSCVAAEPHNCNGSPVYSKKEGSMLVGSVNCVGGNIWTTLPVSISLPSSQMMSLLSTQGADPCVPFQGFMQGRENSQFCMAHVWHP